MPNMETTCWNASYVCVPRGRSIMKASVVFAWRIATPRAQLPAATTRAMTRLQGKVVVVLANHSQKGCLRSFGTGGSDSGGSSAPLPLPLEILLPAPSACLRPALALPSPAGRGRHRPKTRLPQRLVATHRPKKPGKAARSAGSNVKCTIRATQRDTVHPRPIDENIASGKKTRTRNESASVTPESVMVQPAEIMVFSRALFTAGASSSPSPRSASSSRNLVSMKRE
mmetsp:Transcript_86721/g.258787  ORF Transcript_86721/g.258787 Transcript_86721/m.258787 type:complete len:227 (-) Transcript_86721:623-1303(-)